MMVSDKRCFFCENTLNLDEHHCLHGTANRKKAEKYKLTVWLCRWHHTLGIKSVHKCKETDLQLKRFAQKYFLENIGDMELWMKEFGKNYL
jgi:hypothetical protein